MHDFKVTSWPDKTYYTVEVACTSGMADLYQFTPDEAQELLDCLKSVLDGDECSHTHVHRIESKDGQMFTLLFSVSPVLTRAYTVSKSKLRNLRIRLMGVING